MRVPVLAILLCALPARGMEPPSRYGDPVRPEIRSALASAVEQQVLLISQRNLGPRREGAPAALLIDSRLEAALDAVAAALPRSGPPGVSVSERALWLAGIVEPTPYLMTMLVPPGADADVMQQVEKLLPSVLAQGRYRRLAVATVPYPAGGVRLALALQESFVEMQPVMRQLSLAGSTPLAGRILAPYDKPVVVVTAPSGKVTRLSGQRVDGRRFSAEFHCGPAHGAYQVELLGEDRLGESVLANFPISCGVVAPSGMEAAAEPERAGPRPGAPVEEVRASVEKDVLELLNRDRAAAGLPALAGDPDVAAVARAYSAEMRDNNFFGHISPTSGSAMDRLRRAGIDALRVRENLGRAWSARELQHGLMDSPSHRANVLATDVERVGVGVAVGEVVGQSGTRDLFLTQLFVHFPQPFVAARAEADLRARLLALRKEAGVAALGSDAALDGVARAVAAGMVGPGGSVKPADAKDDPIDKAMPELAPRWKWVRKVTAVAGDVALLAASPALGDKQATHAGIGLAPAKDGIVVVILMAAQR